jgi:hypothetical protein
MEAVTPLDHDFRITSLHDSSCKDVHSREIIVDHLEVLELGGIDDLLIYLREVLGSLRCYLSDGLVTIEPTPAWTNLQAV